MREAGEPHYQSQSLIITELETEWVETQSRFECNHTRSCKGNSQSSLCLFPSLPLSLSFSCARDFLFKCMNLRNSQHVRRDRSRPKKRYFRFKLCRAYLCPRFFCGSHDSKKRQRKAWLREKIRGVLLSRVLRRQEAREKRERESNIAEQATWATIAADYPFLIKAFVPPGQKPITATTAFRQRLINKPESEKKPWLWTLCSRWAGEIKAPVISPIHLERILDQAMTFSSYSDVSVARNITRRYVQFLNNNHNNNLEVW